MLEVEKLYQIKMWFWLIHPSKHTVLDGSNPLNSRHLAIDIATYCSRKLKCNITYIPENSIFCLLERDEKTAKVLSTSGELGWMVCPSNEDWPAYFEKVKEE